jgi:hypothetical protein
MSLFETLESRRLASTSLNINLVVNGDAEAGAASENATTAVSIPGWTTNGMFTVMRYNTPGFLLDSDNVPADHGRNFFSGGKLGPVGGLETAPTATQIINVADIARDIDAGLIGYDFSASLGGFGAEDDTMNVELAFADANQKVLNTVAMNGPSAAVRGNKSGLIKSGETGSVPVGTRMIGIRLTATHKRGVVADGYADNISLKLTSTMSDATITGTVFNDINGNGKQDAGERGLARATVTGAPVQGQGELLRIGVTDENGRYTIPGVQAGKVMIGVQAPPGFRRTGPGIQTLTTVEGLTIEAPQAFGLTQRAVISGSVVRDPTAPVLDDDDDTNGLRNITVWLDANNNGKLDRGERSTKTDEDGNFQFIVPRGKYTVRVAPSRGYQQATPTKNRPIKLTIGNGARSIGNIFSMVPLPA